MHGPVVDIGRDSLPWELWRSVRLLLVGNEVLVLRQLAVPLPFRKAHLTLVLVMTPTL